MSRYLQPVNYKNQYSGTQVKNFAMIDNYIYFYHTKTLLLLPTFPETIQDSTSVSFSSVTPMSRSAPIYSYTSSGPRTVVFNFSFHRDMMNDVNLVQKGKTQFGKFPDIINDDDYVDQLINQLEAVALPAYAVAEKMVNPPVIAVKIGKDIFCKGVVSGAIAKEYSGPILRTEKYAMIAVSFTVNEVDLYDAQSVAKDGSFRGCINTDLERSVRVGGSTGANKNRTNMLY